MIAAVAAQDWKRQLLFAMWVNARVFCVDKLRKKERRNYALGRGVKERCSPQVKLPLHPTAASNNKRRHKGKGKGRADQLQFTGGGRAGAGAVGVLGG